MDKGLSFIDMLKTLPGICREQRRFFGWSQTKAADKLHEKYGLQKDASKISLLESGKTLIPDFLSEYCEMLGIQFSRPEYRRVNMEVKPNDVIYICEKVKEYTTNIMKKMGCELHEDYDIEVKFVDGYYIAAAIEKIVFPCNEAKDDCFLLEKWIFAFLATGVKIRLCGRMKCYQGDIMLWIDHNKKIISYLNSRTVEVGEMAAYMGEILNAHLLELDHGEFYFWELYPGYISILEDTYVYQDERQRGCLTAMIHYLDSCDSIEGRGTWISSTVPVYLQEKEYKRMGLPQDKYSANNNEEDKKQMEQNIEILKKLGATDFVYLGNTTNRQAPYAVCNQLFHKSQNEYEFDVNK